MSKQTRKHCFNFRGSLGLADAGSETGNPFVKAITASAGSPVVQGINGGGLRLQLASNSESENVCVYMGDVLPFLLSELISVEIIAKCSASLDANTQIAIGLASARNNTIDSIAEAALFRCIGNNTVVAESDDGSTNIDDVPTGVTLGDSWKRFSLDFVSRISSMEPPTLSLGRGSNIEFYGTNDNGSKRRVASGTRFDMSNYSGGLQLFFQIQKASGSATDYLDILEAEVITSQSV